LKRSESEIQRATPKITKKVPKAKKFDSKMAQKEDLAPKPEKKVEKAQTSKMESVVGAIGSIGRSVATKARDKYNDLYSIHYNLSEEVSVQDLFTAFGGQTALTRLQIQSSEASISFKKYVKSLKPKEASEINKRTKDIDKKFEEENLMQNVILPEASQIDQDKYPEIAECLGRPLEPSPIYARNHFVYLTSLSIQRVDPAQSMDENFTFITNIISELQFLLSRYESIISNEQDRKKLLPDAIECIKLITDSSYLLVPVYKYQNFGPT
jgi:hypothetical protein